MKEFSYSKKKVFKSARLIFLIFLTISFIIYLKSGFIYIIFLPIFLTIHYIFLIHRVLTIQVLENYIVASKRSFWFYYSESKIVPDNGVYQYWEYTFDIRGKGNVYSIKQNSYIIFKLNSIDEWDKETIEANIFLRNKITGKDSIIDKKIVENEIDYKNHIIKKINRFTLVRNDVYVEVEDLTSIVISDVGYSSYCVIYAEERNKKVDFYISLRSSPPEIRLKPDKKK